ncbi:putative wd tetratricopeptide repeat domain-containing protein [Golovinomyces cichoracearum]|uniref:Putative wd tetratricopeptide repeat domain-containing protein n=1 Tax=Golovinomyces cichoracearum TaxID=62708 RepID=A0A420HQ54_9PEZI|nr:putative wd tetratricopeptide repeat domain-containing protein [Golovinomyces cichoracearum]
MQLNIKNNWQKALKIYATALMSELLSSTLNEVAVARVQDISEFSDEADAPLKNYANQSKSVDSYNDHKIAADKLYSDLLIKLEKITEELHKSPYDLILYLQRASIYSALNYPDLAVGDSYRALLLCDECTNEGFEYHELAWAALCSHCINGETPKILISHVEKDDSLTDIAYSELSSVSSKYFYDDNSLEASQVLQAAHLASLKCYYNLSVLLYICQCMKSAFEFCSRGLNLMPKNIHLLKLKSEIEASAKKESNGTESFDIDDLSDEGWARREIYPWNHYEPDRFSQETLEFLNRELALIAPKCEVRITELVTLQKCASSMETKTVPEPDKNHAEVGSLNKTSQQLKNKQLGIFAKEDILPGETILKEFSLLTANNRLKDSSCDACCAELPELKLKNNEKAIEETALASSCPQCDDTFFCSTECRFQAEQRYHPAVCDKEDVDIIGKDPSIFKEKPIGLYFLLLCRAFAMASTQKIHPLNLIQIKYIWGDFSPTRTDTVAPNHDPVTLNNINSNRDCTLPFSFKYNVAEPLHVLEKMDIDIFANLANYDLWVINTLYSKFRGTASASVNEVTGHPEVAAVHPLWCFANHDCDPNVQWKWEREKNRAFMHLWCREKRMFSDSTNESGDRLGNVGIQAGQEILNHYCDINLNIRQRREWALGSLGGWCQCARCLREEKEKKEE